MERDRVLVVFLYSTCRLEPAIKDNSLVCLIPLLTTRQERKAKGRSIRRW